MFKFEDLSSKFLTGIVSQLDTRSQFRLAQVCRFWHIYVYSVTETLNVSDFWTEITPEVLQRVLVQEPRPANLKALSLANCQYVTSGALKMISQVSSLESIDLSHCSQLTDRDLYYLSLLRNLKSVKIQWPHFSAEGWKQIATLRLERLDLSGSFGFDHSALKYLQHLKKTLKHLDLSFCSQISSNSLKHLECLTQLEHLSLKMCTRVGNNGLKHLPKLNNLRSLNLYGCSQVSDDGLKSISHLGALEKLDISYCVRVTDVGIQALGKLENLEELELEGCSSVSEIGLLCLRSVKHLNVFGCSAALHDHSEEHSHGPHIHYNPMKESFHIRQGDGAFHRRAAKRVTFCV